MNIDLTQTDTCDTLVYPSSRWNDPKLSMC
jgi:hypothetical protein